MSPRLALHLLGPPQLYLDEKSISFNRRKSLALMAYLSMERDQHRRESLSALLWPDTSQSSAFKNLRQVLWEIQQILGEDWLITDRETVCLNDHADIWLDAGEFDSLIMQSESQEHISLRLPLLADAAGLYRHHFLAGFSLKDAHPFNDWAFAVSEGLRSKLANVLRRLSEDYLDLGQARQAVPHARRLVSLDPLNESAHRQLMEVYLQAGEHSAALKQYQTCEQILRRELNLDPQPETRELYKKIRKGDTKPIQVEKQSRPVAPKHNLPPKLSTFIGREKQQDEIIQLLAKSRIVTLAGTGGIGKTTLSVQVGQKLLPYYSDGVWFIAFDALAEPRLVPQTVGSIFDIREGGTRSITERLTEFLQKKTALLIFDNCEHLLEVCATLATTLLGNCPDLKILATSRETLNVAGEAVYYMPSLSIPEGEEAVEDIIQYESIRLFAERATLALSSFQLTKENAQTILEICRKVDGIPLAIELAAARVNILKEEEILEQLEASFALLASDSRSILPRHQTLQASMDWGWGLLEELEQVFLRQLSVFAGGWTLESAQAVCDRDILDLTSALVRKSLIVVDRKIESGTRYHFHEMVRQFVYKKLQDAGEEATVRTRHLKYFLVLTEQAEVELRGPSRVDWMERLDEERNNLRAALAWADDTDVEAGLYLSSRLMRYWESSNLPEGNRWLKNFIHKPETKNFPRARAYALHTYAWLLTWLQKFDEAYSVADECLILFRADGDWQGEVDSLIILANILQFKDEMERSNEIGKLALEYSQSMGDIWRQANALNYLGWGHADPEIKFDYWKKAINLYREVGDQINLANLLGLLGQFQVLNGEFETGEKNLDEALLLWQSNRKANIWENPKIAKSLILSMHGEYEQARTLLEEVKAASQETGNLMASLWAEARLGYVSFHSGSLNEARQLLGESARNFVRGGNTIGAIFALEGLAGLDATVGKNERAARLIGWADAARQKIPDIRPAIEQADIDLSMAACMARMGEQALSEAYAAGREMTLEEAAAYALEES